MVSNDGHLFAFWMTSRLKIKQLDYLLIISMHDSWQGLKGVIVDWALIEILILREGWICKVLNTELRDLVWNTYIGMQGQQ